jgi:hypothetical protein
MPRTVFGPARKKRSNSARVVADHVAVAVAVNDHVNV